MHASQLLDVDVQVLHVDAALAVVYKPSGLLSVPGRGADKQDCVATRVQTLYADALIVHRLDMATSGLMLLARGTAMQRQLSIAFAQREVSKRYISVVAGLVSADHAEIELPLLTDWPNRPRQRVDHAHGKPSLTRYRVLSRDRMSNTSRLELEPVTGRSHQLRVHLCEIGHPIVGDALYAPPEVCAGAGRLLLHASSIGLRHPVTGLVVQFESVTPF
jgi:tRNA pseudouridine32 synthase / 23S rRNA pseudouridine746 synthase